MRFGVFCEWFSNQYMSYQMCLSFCLSFIFGMWNVIVMVKLTAWMFCVTLLCHSCAVTARTFNESLKVEHRFESFFWAYLFRSQRDRASGHSARRQSSEPNTIVLVATWSGSGYFSLILGKAQLSFSDLKKIALWAVLRGDRASSQYSSLSGKTVFKRPFLCDTGED